MKNSDENQAWPLRFDSFSFGSRCYNTLQSSVIFDNRQFALHLEEPSGQPRSTDWKEKWSGGHLVMNDRVFPPPIEINWTSLDGIEHRASVDLAAVFPGRVILHNVPREDVWKEWALVHLHSPDILLEVNDRAVNVYMKAHVLTNQLKASDDKNLRVSTRQLVLAWANMY